MPIKYLRLIANKVAPRSDFLTLLVCVEKKWFLVSKQLFVEQTRLQRSFRHDRLEHGENSVTAARRVISMFFGGCGPGHIVPGQCKDFRGAAPKRLHWPAAIELSVTMAAMPLEIKKHLQPLDRKPNNRIEQTLQLMIKKTFEPRLKNLRQVAATEAA